MNIISEFLIYIIEHRAEILNLLFQHIRLTAFAVIFSIMLGVPFGILIKHVQKLNKPILGFANIIQAIPSMALLGISIPILGIGSAPAIFIFSSSNNKKHIYGAFKYKPSNNRSGKRNRTDQNSSII